VPTFHMLRIVLVLDVYRKKGKTYTKEEWIDKLQAQHSTIEMCQIVVRDVVRGDVASHIVRHTKGHPRFTVESGRPDWTGKPRPPVEALREIIVVCESVCLD